MLLFDTISLYISVKLHRAQTMRASLQKRLDLNPVTLVSNHPNPRTRAYADRPTVPVTNHHKMFFDSLPSAQR
jgi:hypothetical protein